MAKYVKHRSIKQLSEAICSNSYLRNAKLQCQIKICLLLSCQYKKWTVRQLIQITQMQTYFTPIKSEAMCLPKQTKTAAQPREGDWVCLNCNNLNFSFRKKCNRCKTQTRQQNESSTAYYLNYYSKSYIYAPLPPPCHNSSHTTSANSPLPTQTPLYNHPNKENLTPEKPHKELPSVSPLLKKYNARETTPVSESGSEDSLWGVTVRDFEDPLGSSGRSDDSEGRGEDSAATDDLQRMISRIML